MITHIAPEPGGEAAGIVRLELSVPFDEDEVRALRDWLAARGWSIEADQIDAYLAGEDWQP